MIARVRQWGNSLAIRLRRTDARKAGVADGDLVQVRIVKVAKSGRLDLRDLPTFEDDDPEVSIRHDRYLYG